MSENQADVACIQDYLAHVLPSPSPWIFVRDTSCIFPDLSALKLLDRRYQVIVYDGDLQLRRKLEEYKDDREKQCACIVSRQPPELERHVLDYVARCQVVELTPQALLEFSQPGYKWGREVNQLIGEDFWSLFEPLQKYRRNWGHALTPTEGVDVVLSARLDCDLSAKLSPREAVYIWEQLENDTALLAWGKRYPKLFQALNLKVYTALPLMKKLEDDKDFVRFLWTSFALAQHSQNYDLFLPRIFGETVWKKYANTTTSDILDGATQLIRNNPTRVMEHIKQTEMWLTQDTQRYALFLRWVGVDTANLDKTADYAERERLLCAPLRDALRLLAEYICHSPEAFAQNELRELTENLRRKHLFSQDETNYLRIKDTFQTFTTLVALNRLIGVAEGEHRAGELDCTSLISQYVDVLSKIELTADSLEQFNFQCNLLPDKAIAQALNRAQRLIVRCNASFARQLTDAYPVWIKGHQKTMLTLNFLDNVLMPYYRKYITTKSRSAYVFLLDGIRWDTWRLLQPKVLQAFQGKFALETVLPLVSILPTTTAYNKYAIITGEFPTSHEDNWWEALVAAFRKRHINGARWVSDHGNNQSQMLSLIDADDVPVKVFNLTLLDRKLHYAKQNLSTVYEEIKINFERLVQPYLERIPSDSLVFLISDHGFIEVTAQQEVAKDLLQPDTIAASYPRYVTLSSFAAPLRSEQIVSFSADEIGLMPTNNALRYGFATGQTLIQREVNTNEMPRYVHGGVSLQEMIVPCAVFVPTGEGQLELWGDKAN